MVVLEMMLAVVKVTIVVVMKMRVMAVYVDNGGVVSESNGVGDAGFGGGGIAGGNGCR